MGIKVYIYIIIFTVLAAAIGGAVWYFKWSQAEMKVLNENIAKQEIALQLQEVTIQQQQTDAIEKNEQIVLVNNQFADSRKENNNLRKKLSKHDIAYLASSKPEIVSRILTKGTKSAERCFAILSGSELTEREKTATKRSQINTICPSIANPSFTGTP